MSSNSNPPTKSKMRAYRPQPNKTAEVVENSPATQTPPLAKELLDFANRAESLTQLFNEIIQYSLGQAGIIGAAHMRVFDDQLSQSVRLKVPTFFEKNVQFLEELSQNAVLSVANSQSTTLDSATFKRIQLVSIASTMRQRNEGNQDILHQDVLSFAITKANHDSDQAKSFCEIVASVLQVWKGRYEIAQRDDELRSAAATIELIGKLETCRSSPLAAQTLCNEVCKYLNASLVAVGFCNGRSNRKRSQCKLASVSGNGELDRQGKIGKVLNSVFQECLENNTNIGWPNSGAATVRQNVFAHEKLAENLRVESAQSFLLIQGDQNIGVLTVCGSRSLRTARSVQGFLNAIGKPVGNAMATVRLAELGMLGRAAKTIRSSSQKWTLLLGLIIAIAFFCCMWIPVEYTVSCACKAEPLVSRFCVAPQDGLLEKTMLLPGESVKKGDLIGLLNGKEIRWELASLTAELNREEKLNVAYKANHEVGKNLQTELKIKELIARRELLKYRLGNLKITSPIDGIVIGGTTQPKENLPVSKGETICEIAPLEQIRIELEVSADEIINVEKGMPVKFSMDGFGGQQFDGIVEKVRPRSEIRQQKNHFIAEVIVANQDDLIRPGMQGYAAISSNRSTLGWKLFHHSFEKIWNLIRY